MDVGAADALASPRKAAGGDASATRNNRRSSHSRIVLPMNRSAAATLADASGCHRAALVASDSRIRSYETARNHPLQILHILSVRRGQQYDLRRLGTPPQLLQIFLECSCTSATGATETGGTRVHERRPGGGAVKNTRAVDYLAGRPPHSGSGNDRGVIACQCPTRELDVAAQFKGFSNEGVGANGGDRVGVKGRRHLVAKPRVL